MIDLTKLNLIQDILQDEDKDELIRLLLSKYAQDSSENAGKLLTLIPNIASIQLSAKQSRINRYCWAYETLLCERHEARMKARKQGKKLPLMHFAALLAGGVAHFPDPSCTCISQVELAFVQELIDCIKSREGFDYENAKDWDYVDKIVDCQDWLIQFIRCYIDPKFELPTEAK